MSIILTNQSIWMLFPLFLLLLVLFLFLLALVHLIGKHLPAILEALARYQEQQRPFSSPPASSSTAGTPPPHFRLTVTASGEIVIDGHGAFEVVQPETGERSRAPLQPAASPKEPRLSREGTPQGSTTPDASLPKAPHASSKGTPPGSTPSESSPTPSATAGSGAPSRSSGSHASSSRASASRSGATFEQATAEQARETWGHEDSLSPINAASYADGLRRMADRVNTRRHR